MGPRDRDPLSPRTARALKILAEHVTLPEVLELLSIRVFVCPRCSVICCPFCEGGSESPLCDACWCAVVEAGGDPEPLQGAA